MSNNVASPTVAAFAPYYKEMKNSYTSAPNSGCQQSNIYSGSIFSKHSNNLTVATSIFDSSNIEVMSANKLAPTNSTPTKSPADTIPLIPNGLYAQVLKDAYIEAKADCESSRLGYSHELVMEKTEQIAKERYRQLRDEYYKEFDICRSNKEAAQKIQERREYLHKRDLAARLVSADTCDKSLTMDELRTHVEKVGVDDVLDENSKFIGRIKSEDATKKDFKRLEERASLWGAD